MVKSILDGFLKDKAKSLERTSQHYVAMHGLDGRSGRVGNSGLPDAYQYVTMNNSPVRELFPSVYASLDRYVESFKDGEQIKSVYLWSKNPGTGKTTTSAALLNAYIATDYLRSIKEGKHPKLLPAVFLDANSFQTQYNLAMLSKDEDDIRRIKEIIKRVQHAPYAVLDDVGVRSSTEAFRSYLHDIINYRVTNNLPTVYTTNLPIEEMRNIYDERLYDRIRDKSGIIHLDGESSRGFD